MTSHLLHRLGRWARLDTGSRLWALVKVGSAKIVAEVLALFPQAPPEAAAQLHDTLSGLVRSGFLIPAHGAGTDEA